MSRSRNETEQQKARRLLRQTKRNTYLRDRYWSDPEYRERRRLEARERARDRRAMGYVDARTLRCPICEGLTIIAQRRFYEKAIDRSRWCATCCLEIRTTEVIVELVKHNDQPSADGAIVEHAS